RLSMSLREHERLKVDVLWVARWWTLTRLALQARFEADARPRASGLQADHECGSRINEPSPELEDDAGGPGELRGGDKRSGGVREAVTESGDRLEYVFDDHIPGVRLDPRVLLYGCTCSSPWA